MVAEKRYRVVRMTELVWGKAELLDDFHFPWIDRPAPRTEFRAAVVGDRLHFRFDVEDDDVVIKKSDSGFDDVLGSDRVELFLACDGGLCRYYGFEIDPLGRVLDYSAKYHRKFDYAWSLSDLRTEGAITDDGYQVEASLSLASLEMMDCLKENRLIAGVYRAEFSRSSSRDAVDYNWISWCNPKTPKPDFHVPESFGEFWID